MATEIYKRGFRVEDLSEYSMPTIFHWNGRIMRHRLGRALFSFLTLGLLILILLSVSRVDQVWFAGSKRGMVWGLGWGLVAGFLAAFVGAFLDVPWEGFFPIKFLRSIWVGGYCGIVFSFLTENPVLLICGCFGMDRMSLEFYKTFVRKMKSGKFKADKPVIQDWVEKRKVFIYPYLATWLVFIFLLVAF